MARYQNIERLTILKEPKQVLMNFQDLLRRLNEALDDEALLEPFQGDCTCAWHDDLDAAWRGVAEDAANIRDDLSHGALLPLKRMAGLILRAVEAEGFEDLEKVRQRGERCVAALGIAHTAVCRELVMEAHECIDRMVSEAAVEHARDVVAETRFERREQFAA